MIVYHVMSGGEELIRKVLTHCGTILISYAYPALFPEFREMGEKGIRTRYLFVDSGAYTVWCQGGAINLQRYGNFLKGLREETWYDNMIAANLDYLAGNPKKIPTPREWEQSAKRSHSNWVKLKQMGVETLPVFHWGEEFHWLDRMLEESDYICLAAGPKRPVQQRMKWLDAAWRRIFEKNPKVRVHGLGLTSVKMLIRYPWTSVDSFTALSHAGYGQILLPKFTEFGENYFDGGNLVAVGRGLLEGQKRKVSGGDREVEKGFFGTSLDLKSSKSATISNHISNLKDFHIERIRKYLNGIGLDVEDLIDNKVNRMVVNVTYFSRLVENLPKDRTRWAFEKVGNFDEI